MGKHYDYICENQNKYKIEHWILKELLKTEPDKKRSRDSYELRGPPASEAAPGPPSSGSLITPTHLHR